jgi:hypothetical protein
MGRKVGNYTFPKFGLPFFILRNISLTIRRATSSLTDEII